ncbi:MAG: hypothetical protein QXS54_00770 [Candidatus Methanomethylicaceae archaeon]
MISTIRASTILALSLVEFDDEQMDTIRRQSIEAISQKNKVMRYLFEVLEKRGSPTEYLVHDETRERLRSLLLRVPFHVVDQFVARLEEIWEQIEADPYRDMKVLHILEDMALVFIANEYDNRWPLLSDSLSSYDKRSSGNKHKMAGYTL